MLIKTTTEDDLNGFVGLVKELIPVDGKLGKLNTNLPIYTYYPLSILKLNLFQNQY